MLFIRILLLIVFLVICASSHGKEYRTFTGTNGREIEARFISFDQENQTVKIILKDGREQTVLLSLFSEQDREFIRNNEKTDNPFNADDAATTNISTSVEVLPSENPLESPKLLNANREERWNADLTWLRDNLPKFHCELFMFLPEKQYYRQMNEIINSVSDKSDSEIVSDLTRLIVRIRSCHTRIIGYKMKTLPIRFFEFDDGMFVTSVEERNRGFYGKKLTGIGKYPLAEVIKKLKPFTASENEYSVKVWCAKNMENATILYWAGVIDSDESVSYEFSDGELTLSTSEYRDTRYSPDKSKFLYLKNSNINYWYEILNDNTIYICYKYCRNMKDYPFTQFLNDVFKEIDSRKLSRIIFDVRMNDGGNSDIILPLFDELKKRPAINAKNNIKVIVGRNTFSSGRFAVYYFNKFTKATVVGEPSGNSPNAHGEIGRLTLSNTSLKVQYTKKFFRLSENPKSNTMTPDVFVRLKSSEWFNGKDAFLEAALK